MGLEQRTVFLVDDDAAVRKSLGRALRKRGLSVKLFNSAKSFIDSYEAQPGCLVLDLSMPGVNGLELQSELQRRGISIPIIFITGHGGIPQAVQALKAGAIDFLEKPLRIDSLCHCIQDAFTVDANRRDQKRQSEAILSRFKHLTNRETEVLQLLVSDEINSSSKEVARKLGISHRTVEVHRARVLEKTQTRSVLELTELVRKTGVFTSKID